MSAEDRKLIWLLIMVLGGVYVLLLPMPLAALAMAGSIYAGRRATSR